MMNEEERGRCGEELAQSAACGSSAEASQGAGASKKPQAARPRRKWPIVAGCVAAVVAVAAAGFFVWHEQPGFCNAVCHVPMDNYVQGYFEDESLCANAHYREGATCLQCHEPKLDEQIAEGLAWIRGDFDVDEKGDIVKVGVTADEAMCAKSGCHDMDDVVVATEDWGGEQGVNPHKSHQGSPIDCANCHGVHKESNMYCNTCHDYETPQGWTNPA